jgi:hypothetical protein
MNQIIARWESRSGKHWVELEYDGIAAIYRGNGCGGCMGKMSQEQALTEMQKRVDSGYFLPDAAKTPMKRVR